MKSSIPGFDKKELLHDYKIALISRHLSIAGRKEVHLGRANFGIFGDGKEIAQIVLSKFFRDGDWRSGYYRDQTMMLALGLTTPEIFFAQLYGDTNSENNPDSGGRSMNNHYATPNINKDGSWKDLTKQKNSASDISPTAGQLPRSLGLAYASKLYRQKKDWHQYTQFSDEGNEVIFATVGDASTSEGHFFETMNAAGVLQVPLAMSVWDDGYGISVPRKYQTIKESISEIMEGFAQDDKHEGILIYRMRGWKYEELYTNYREGLEKCRNEHIPVLFHVDEMTQPLGHSTSGSHERYKSKERLDWEQEYDPIARMKEWLLSEHYADEKTLSEIEKEAKKIVKEAKKKAWKNFISPIEDERKLILDTIKNKTCTCKKGNQEKIERYAKSLSDRQYPTMGDIFSTSKKILREICFECEAKEHLKSTLTDWIKKYYPLNHRRYSSHLYAETNTGKLTEEVLPAYSGQPEMVDGRIVLRDNFDALFSKYPLSVTFGEDTGQLGGVNQCMEGMQEKYGELRVTDTGIRESTITGQAIGLALRGIKPIAEIQYFDYILYALQTLSDDLATMHYRTKGIQKAPVIIRTRGHRFEGIWHSGSPLSLVMNAIRGIHVCVPRNMTQAAGFYNTLMESDDPALVVEPLLGYRVKEKLPSNPGEYKVPLGKPEVLTHGTDVTIVTYGSCVRIALEAARQLAGYNVSCEVVDVQTLLPFDTNHLILESVKKTNRVIFVDEDVPGGASAFMMQKVLEIQGAYKYLDSAPVTISAHEHRPAYGSDGDYFSNPNAEDIFEKAYEMMNEFDPANYPYFYEHPR